MNEKKRETYYEAMTDKVIKESGKDLVKEIPKEYEKKFKIELWSVGVIASTITACFNDLDKRLRELESK